jgi:hypothetical protein
LDTGEGMDGVPGAAASLTGGTQVTATRQAKGGIGQIFIGVSRDSSLKGAADSSREAAQSADPAPDLSDGLPTAATDIVQPSNHQDGHKAADDTRPVLDAQSDGAPGLSLDMILHAGVRLGAHTACPDLVSARPPRMMSVGLLTVVFTQSAMVHPRPGPEPSNSADHAARATAKGQKKAPQTKRPRWKLVLTTRHRRPALEKKSEQCVNPKQCLVPA